MRAETGQRDGFSTVRLRGPLLGQRQEGRVREDLPESERCGCRKGAEIVGEEGRRAQAARRGGGGYPATCLLDSAGCCKPLSLCWVPRRKAAGPAALCHSYRQTRIGLEPEGTGEPTASFIYTTSRSEFSATRMTSWKIQINLRPCAHVCWYFLVWFGLDRILGHLNWSF